MLACRELHQIPDFGAEAHTEGFAFGIAATSAAGSSVIFGDFPPIDTTLGNALFWLGQAVVLCAVLFFLVNMSSAQRCRKWFFAQTESFHDCAALTGSIMRMDRLAPIISRTVAVLIKSVNIDRSIGTVDGVHGSVRQDGFGVSVVDPNRMSADRGNTRIFDGSILRSEYWNGPIVDSVIPGVRGQLNLAKPYREPCPNVKVPSYSIPSILKKDADDAHLVASKCFPNHKRTVLSPDSYVGSFCSLELPRGLLILSHYSANLLMSKARIESSSYEGAKSEKRGETSENSRKTLPEKLLSAILLLVGAMLVFAGGWGCWRSFDVAGDGHDFIAIGYVFTGWFLMGSGIAFIFFVVWWVW